MSKGGVYRIKGDENPKVGVKTYYNVVEWYPETPHSQRNQSLVTWELYLKTDDGYRSTGIKKKGINYFTFGPNAHKFSYKIEGYLHEAEGKEPMAIFVQPQKKDQSVSQEKEILGIDLSYQDGSKITKTLHYMDRSSATAKCQNLALHSIVFKLWEDDEVENGHNSKNQFITKSPPITVDARGNARWDFTLFNTYIALANKREDEKKKHEYYVTAEYFGKTHASQNVNVYNPEDEKKTTPSKTSTSKTPKDKHHPLPTRTSTNKPKPKQNSPKASSKPTSKNNQVDIKGYVKSVKITDKNGNAFTRNPKFGEAVRVIIDAKDVKGLDYNLRIWESDYIGGDDILYNEIHRFKNDLQYILCPLTDKMRIDGELGNDKKNPDSGEYNSGYYQEIFAEIVFMHVSTKSSNIDVDLNAEQIKQVKGLSTTIVDKKPEEKKDGVCECQKYNLIWGSKVSCDFRKKVVKISEELWPDNYLKMANNLMAIFAWESGGTFKPDAPNQANSGGTGLIQFMPSTAKDLLGHEITMETVKNYYGKKYNKKTKQKEDWNLDRVKDFAEMTAIKQLDYVKKFFDSLKGKKLEFVDFYLKVLFPVSSGLPEHVVFADNVKKLDRPSETDKLKNKRVSSYSKNKGMDLNKDGKLMKSEIKISVQKYLTEGLPYSKIEKCENIIEKKSAAITGKCAEGKVVEEFIDNFLITKNKIDNCNKHAMTQDVKIIVLHRTAGGFASGTLNHMKSEGYGAHFVVDYDGTVYQTIGINKRGSHMGVAQFASTKTAGWGNNNSIAIETCGYSIDKDGNNRVGKKYDNIPHHHWEVVKNNQAKSVACLLKFLLNHFKLNIGDVKVHEKLCKKQPLEGQNVYDAMLPYYNNK